MSEPRLSEAFEWPLRVYYEDTDAGGVVYHTSYLRFIERARTEWLRAHGVMQSKLEREHSILFAVTKIEIDFLAPARLDDELIAHCRLEKLAGASMLFKQFIVRKCDGVKLISAMVNAACLNAKTFRPVRIPTRLLNVTIME